MENELDPGYGAQPAPSADSVAVAPATPPAASPQLLSPMMQHFSDASDAALARFRKLQEADSRLKAVRGQLDKLTELGDMVGEEDILDAATALVADGLGATAVAGLLADMPQPSTPAALQSWIAEHDQQVQQREAQLAGVMKLAQHELALTGVRQLTAQAAEDHQIRTTGAPHAD